MSSAEAVVNAASYSSLQTAATAEDIPAAIVARDQLAKIASNTTEANTRVAALVNKQSAEATT
ncbi:hypothetical protein A2W24_07155 [Microgenomates group bacterium RBG_16_45_19]|nr:MAG: hypothetical protein A2W24_07155 [Microgenomates group bacterium RBG_16_45_19]